MIQFKSLIFFFSYLKMTKNMTLELIFGLFENKKKKKVKRKKT